jgi:hypothetical protein
MKSLSELLREGDPLQHEATWPSDQRDARRQAVLAAASAARTSNGTKARSRIPVFITATLTVITALILGAVVWSLVIRDLQAAISFEVRLAEDRPAPGLREAKVSGSDQSVYLHDEVVVTNRDIESARVIQTGGASQYEVSIEFNAAGAEKMRAATRNNIGKRMAILLDGQVVMALVLRSRIGAKAMITGDYTRAQAERVAKGIAMH